MNEPKTVVIYHRADFDGIFCREIAKKFMPHAVLIGWDYGDPEPGKDIIDENTNLYILDLSVPSLMDHPKLVWIDHHKSAIEKYPSTIPGYRIDGVAACRLAWQWFRIRESYGQHEAEPNATLPGKNQYVDRFINEPLTVRLAGEYDIWDKRDPNAELFQHGLRSCELTAEIWNALLCKNGLRGLEHDNPESRQCVIELLDNGRAIQYAKTQENAGIIESYGFTVRWMGLTFLVCNHARFNSHLFTAGLKPEHDACLGFNWDGNNNCWRFSLYHRPGREDLDLSEIAKTFGGGGHRGACGFRHNTIPFFQ
jgi:hypothetical protein